MLGAILGGSLISGLLGLAGSSQQATAAQQAARTQARAAENAARLQQQQYQQTRQDLMPYMQQGTSAVSQLGGMLGEGGALRQGFSITPEEYYATASQGFEYDPYSGIGIATRESGLPTQQEAYEQYSAPISIDLYSDPSYQARLQAGQEAIQGSQAALGKFFSGQTGKELTKYGQELAAQEYANAYNRKMAERQLGMQAYQQGVAGDLAQKQFEAQQGQAGLAQDIAQRQYMGDVYNLAQNQYLANQQQQYNMLYGLSGLGQSAASQAAQQGAQAAQLQGGYGMQGAGALAGGYTGQAGAWSNALQNIGNQLQSGIGSYMNYRMMQNAGLI